MPQGFDDAYKPANPFANIPTPFLDDAAAPHNPVPEWKPTARGDAKALLPYVDDDIGETEKSNPVGDALAWSDRAHLGVEAAANGGKTAAEVAEEAEKFMLGGSEGAESVLGGISAFAAPLAIAGGAVDLVEGIDLLRHGETAEGLIKTTEGAAGVTSGGAGIATFAGSTAAATVAAGAGAGAVGLGVGHFGDNQVKKHGWIHDSEGKALSASEWAGHNGRRADDYLTEHGHPHLGTAAGIATTAVSVVPAAGIAVGGAVVGGVDTLEDAGSWLGTKAAHAERAHHYEHYQGIDMTKREAKELADYDDAQREASEHANWNRLQRIWAGDD